MIAKLHRLRHRRHLVRGALLATTFLGGQALAQALPTGGTVVAGGATISRPSATTTLIQQSTAKAVINWTDFSIGQGNAVVFQQPNAGSIALNRVTGNNGSAIEGALRANGQVWLINPNGIVFGKGATVDVGGLLATTADIRNADFLAGIYNFSGPSQAAIVNEGKLKAAVGGYVGLAAARVDNQGLIEADVGTVALAAGQAYTVDFTGDNLLKFTVTAPVTGNASGSPLIANSGTISAVSGQVALTARATRDVLDNVIDTSGIVVATRARAMGGEIVFDAGDTGSVTIGGTVDASGRGPGGTGGTVMVLGENVALTPKALIDVSGDVGGGTVDLGGLAHGAGAQNAETASVAKGATVLADAITSGAGGNIVVWSQQGTSVAGTLSARGGAQAGDGGFVETSSHGILAVAADAAISTTAAHGLAGTWLLDPYNVTIGNATVNGTYTGGYFTPSASGATVDASAIDASLNAGNNVTIQTGSSGSEAGNITVSSALAKTAGADTTLNLNAAGSILVSAPITSTTGALSLDFTVGSNVTINSQIAVNSAISGGQINFYGGNGSGFTQGAGATIATSGGQRLFIQTDTIALNGAAGSITGTGGVTLQPVQESTTVGLGTGAGSFSLSNAALATLSGFSGVQIGYYYDTGLVSLGGPIAFSVPTTIYSAGSGSSGITAAATTALTVAGGGQLNLQSAGDVTFATGSSIVSGPLAVTGNNVNFGSSFTGSPGVVSSLSLNAGGNATIGGNVTTNNGSVSIVAGNNSSLTVAAGVTVNTGTGPFNGSTGTNGQIAIAGAVAAGRIYLSGGAGSGFTQETNATLAAGGGNSVTIDTDTLSLLGAAGSITGTGGLTLEPDQETTTVGIGTGAGTFKVTQAELNTLSGFSGLQIGYYYDTGLVSLGGPINLPAPTTIYSAGSDSAGITAAASTALTVANGGSLSLQTPGDTTFAAGSSIVSGPLYINAANVSLGSFAGTAGVSASLSITASGNVTLANGITTNGGTINVNTGANGQIVVDGAVSGGQMNFSGGNLSGFTQGAGAPIAVGGGQRLLIETDTIALNGAAGSITGTGAVILEPAEATTTIGLGTGAGTFSLTNAELATLSGFSGLQISYYYNTGLISLGGPINFIAPTTIYSAGSGSSGITAAADTALTVANGGALTLQTAGDLTFAAGANITSGTLNFYGNNAAFNSSFTGSPGVVSSFSLSAAGNATVGADITTNNGSVSISAGNNSSLTIASGVTVDSGTGQFSLSGGTNTQFAVNGAVQAGRIYINGGAGSGFTQGAGATLAAGGGNSIFIQTDTLNLQGAAGSITTTGGVTLQPDQETTSVGIGAGAGTFQVTQAELNTLSGYTGLTIGYYYDTGLVSFSGPVTFAAPTVIYSAGSGSAGMTLDATTVITVANAGSLNLQTSGNLTAAAGSSIVSGPLAVYGNNVAFGGTFTAPSGMPESYLLQATGNATVSGNVTTNNGSVYISSGNSSTLTVATGTTINAGTGSFTAQGGSSAQITVDGAVQAGRIDISGGALSSFTQGANATLATGGGQTLSIDTDSVNLQGAAGSITGTGTIVLEPDQESTTVGIGTGAGMFKVTQAELNALSGFSSLQIGYYYDTGQISIGGPLNFAVPTTIYSAGSGSNGISLDATTAITVANAGALTLQTAGDLTMAAGSSIVAGSLSLIGANVTSAGTFTGTSGTVAPYSLSASGNATVSGNVTTNNGSVTIFAGSNSSLTIATGTTVNAGTGTFELLGSTNTQTTVDGAVQSGRIDITGGAGSGFTQGPNATLAISGANPLLIEADTIDLQGAAGSITGTQSAQLQPSQDATTVGIGTGAGTFQLSQAELNSLSGFTSLQIGYYYDTGLVSIGGPLNFSVPTTIYSAGSGSTGLTVDATTAITVANGGALTLQTAGDLTMAARSGIVAGALTLVGNNVTSGGTFTGTSGTAAPYSLSANGNVTISGNVTTNNGYASISVGAGSTLTLAAGTTLDTGSGSVNVSGNTGTQYVIDGAVTSGQISFAGGAGSGFTQGANATLAASGGQTIQIVTDTIALLGAAGSITGTGSLVLEPDQVSTTVGIGTGAGTFSLTNAELATLNGFSGQQIGYYYDTGLVSIGGPVAFAAPTTILSVGSGSAGLTLDATTAITVANTGSLTLQTAGNLTTAAGSSINSGAVALIGNAVAIGSNITTNNSGFTVSAATGQSITQTAGTIDTGTSGFNIYLNANQTLSLNGTLKGGAIYLSAPGSSAIAFGSNAQLQASGNLTISADNLSSAAAPGALGGTGSFNLAPYDNATTVGFGTGAGTLAITQAVLDSFDGFAAQNFNLNSAGAITFGGALNFASNAFIAPSYSASVLTFASGSLLTTATGKTLTIDTGSDLGLAGTIGLGSGSFNVSANTLELTGSLTETAASVLAVSVQQNLTLNDTETLPGTTSFLASSITLGSAALIDASGAATSSLTFATQPGGLFTQTSGATVAMGTGTLAIQSDAIALNGAAGSITGSGTVSLAASEPYRSISLAATGGSLEIDQATLDKLASFGLLSVGFGGHAQTGQVSIGGAIALHQSTVINGSAVLAAAGAVTSTAAVPITLTFAGNPSGSFFQQAGSTIDLPGSALVIDTDSFSSSAAAGSVTAGSLTLAGSTPGTTIGVGSSGSGTLSLPQAVFNGFTGVGAITIGQPGQTGLTSLGGMVTTPGVPLTFAGPVAVNASATLRTDQGGASGNITFGGTIDGPSDLSLFAGTNGVVDLGVAVGSTTPLTSLAVTAKSATLPSVTTSGAQTYDADVGLGADAAYSGASFSVTGATAPDGANAIVTSSAAGVALGTVDGAAALNVTANGGGAIGLGVVGGTTALSSLSLATTGAITLAGVQTSGAQNYSGSVTLDAGTYSGNSITANGAITLGADTTLNGVSSVALTGSVDGAHALTVNATAGSIALASVGLQTALTSLSATASGGTGVKAGSITLLNGVATTGAQTYQAGGKLYITGTYTAGSFNAAATEADLATDPTITTSGPGGIVIAAPITVANALILEADGGPISLDTIDIGGGAADAIAQLFEVKAATSLTVGNLYAANIIEQDVTGTSTFTGPVRSDTAITLNGADFVFDGPVTAMNGGIGVTASGAVTFDDAVSSAGGDIAVTTTAAAGIVARNITISAVNLPADGTTSGTVTITGAVDTSGSTTTAAAGRVRTLEAPSGTTPPPPAPPPRRPRRSLRTPFGRPS